MGVTHIKSVEDAERLAAALNSPRRDRPFVVVSTPAAQPAPYIDAAAIFDAVGDLARVYVLPTGSESWAFSKAMPQLTQVYGGAGRAYPVGTSWVQNPYRAPLRFAFDPAEGRRATDALIADALRMSNDAGLLSREKVRPVDVDAKVRSLVPPSRAIVQTSDGRYASIWLELLFPELEVQQVFHVGMVLNGSLDPATKRYDASRMVVAAQDALAGYAAGDVVLVEVIETSEHQARLRLHPEVDAIIDRDDVTSNDLDRVSSLMSVGEVLAARVVEPGPHWRLSLLDVDDDEEPKRAPTLLTGGPPWLTPPVPQVSPVPTAPSPAAMTPPIVPESLEPVDVTEPLDGSASVSVAEPPDLTEFESHPPSGAAAPRLPTPLALDRNRRAERPTPVAELIMLRRERDKALSAEQRARQHSASLQRDMAALRNERKLLHNELERTKSQLDRLSAQLSQSRTELRKARQQARRADRSSKRERFFLDPEKQFRHEVYVAWARRVPAAEKEHRPLRDYLIGPEFLDSVEKVDGIDRSKVADVVFEVVTGLADQMPGREMHQLRQSDYGSAAGVVRDDGARSWRVALQVNAPQARRLHFWRLPSGQVELSRVVVHDDFTP